MLLCGWLLACTEPAPQRYDSEFLAMGTRVRLSLLATSPDAAAQLGAQIERSMLRQAIDWYPWTQDASGELKLLNAALTNGGTQEISPALRDLLQRAAAAHQRSEGYFDPAVAPLTQAWGFADMNAARPAAAPDATMLAHWRQSRPTMTALRINGQQISSQRRDLQLDLGGIAKGYALQLALQQLQRHGCRQAAIDMGGQIGIMGADMAERLPAVAIRDPRSTRALASLQLKAGESIATSGDYERHAVLHGRRIHHLLDPHTGLPVTHTQAVTVVSDDAATADAAATALMAAGPENWRRIARRMEVREALRIDATGAIEVTAALYARLQWHPAALQAHRIKPINL